MAGAIFSLQWGRANDGAEISGGRSHTPYWTGFNGAAPMMARKSTIVSTGAANPYLLQWGRANDGAEICRSGSLE